MGRTFASMGAIRHGCIPTEIFWAFPLKNPFLIHQSNMTQGRIISKLISSKLYGKLVVISDSQLEKNHKSLLLFKKKLMNIFQKLITNVHFATAIYNNEKCSFCDSYFQAVSMQYACSYIWNLCDICEIITLMYQFLYFKN